MHWHVILPGLIALVSCVGCVGPARLVRTADYAEVQLAPVVDDLARFDVVFLGELHDSDQGHVFQAAVVEALAERHGRVAVALEMFERDVQAELDRYLAGEIDRDAFLDAARPWSNYARHYEPVVEAQRRRGAPVLAANVPRELARRVVRTGLDAVLGEPFAPREVDPARVGAYREKLLALMREHDANLELADRAIAAQCLKDDAMAESIADFLEREPGTPVIVLMGAFHCEERLGTVERLAARRPDLELVVVGMARRPEYDPDDTAERARGRYVLYVGDSASD
ncbi:MAG: ChaN family lipoprotein [Planctomycetota bacterium]